MMNREIGHSGIVVPSLGLGCWAIGGGTWWGENDDALSIRTIHRAFDLGLRWIDTARVYGFGHSEEVVGKAMRGLPRDQVVVSTKCVLEWRDTEGEFHFSRDGHNVYRNPTPASIRRDLEDSLRCMNLDTIDVLYTHWQCREYGRVPISETMNELMKMKQEGKIRAIGASNVDLRTLSDYVDAGQLDVIQEKLSILDRKPEKELLPFCELHGISLQTYSPIEQGLLSGKAPNDYRPKPGEVRENRVWWRPENIPRVNEMLAGWKDLTEKYHCSLANLCTVWNSMLSPAIHVLCGARKIEQIEENAQALSIELSKEDFLRMKQDADALIQSQCP